MPYRDSWRGPVTPSCDVDAVRLGSRACGQPRQAAAWAVAPDTNAMEPHIHGVRTHWNRSSRRDAAGEASEHALREKPARRQYH